MSNYSNRTFIGEVEITGLNFSNKKVERECNLTNCDFLNNKTYSIKDVITVDLINNGEHVRFNWDYDLYHRFNEDIVRLNNVYGYGYVYKKYTLLGISMFVRVGSYSLRDNVENIFYNDEDVELAIVTCPNLSERLVKGLFKSSY